MSQLEVYLRDIQRLPDFRADPDIVEILVPKMKSGDDGARRKLIESALKFMAELCRKWCPSHIQLDCLQEMSRAVSAKISRYDPSRTSFEDFIGFHAWVAVAVSRRKDKTINLTEHGRKAIRLMRKAELELTDKLGREPNLAELSEHLGLEEDKVSKVKSLAAIFIQGIKETFEENDADGRVRSDQLVSKDDPYQLALHNELRMIVLKVLGPKDGDLLLESLEAEPKGFQALFLATKGKSLSDDAARQAKRRLVKKVINYIEGKER